MTTTRNVAIRDGDNSMMATLLKPHTLAEIRELFASYAKPYGPKRRPVCNLTPEGMATIEFLKEGE